MIYKMANTSKIGVQGWGIKQIVLMCDRSNFGRLTGIKVGKQLTCKWENDYQGEETPEFVCNEPNDMWAQHASEVRGDKTILNIINYW